MLLKLKSSSICSEIRPTPFFGRLLLGLIARRPLPGLSPAAGVGRAGPEPGGGVHQRVQDHPHQREGAAAGPQRPLRRVHQQGASAGDAEPRTGGRGGRAATAPRRAIVHRRALPARAARPARAAGGGQLGACAGRAGGRRAG